MSRYGLISGTAKILRIPRWYSEGEYPTIARNRELNDPRLS